MNMVRSKADMLGKADAFRTAVTRFIVVLALAAAGVAALFPPWVSIVRVGGSEARKEAGFALLFSTPETSAISSPQVDWERLLTEFVCIGGFTGAVFFLVKPRRRTRESAELNTVAAEEVLNT